LPANPVPMEVMVRRSTNGKTLGGRDLEVHDVSSMARIEPPKPPTGLKARGKAEWKQIWESGPWLWPSQDYAWVEQACRAYDDLAAFRAEINKMGLTVTGYNGQVVANPLIAEMRRCEDVIRKCLSALGFSPTDRARLKLTELKAETELQGLVGQPRQRTRGYEEGW
jgi:P27 family predicted phage terminase small subunit